MVAPILTEPAQANQKMLNQLVGPKQDRDRLHAPC